MINEQTTEGSGAAKQRRVLFFSALLWVAVLGSVLLSAHLVRTGLFFWGIPPVPLRANPLLLVVGLCALLLSATVLRLALPRFPRYSGFIACGAVACILTSAGAVLASVYPGSGSIIARDQLRASERPRPHNIFAIPVFFDNGKSDLTRDERKHLIEQFIVYQGCGTGMLYVRGFASSRPYLDYSVAGLKNPPHKDWLNASLANARAVTVQSVLDAQLHIKAQLADPWKTYPEMVAERRLKDIGLDGKLLGDTERLNRRVEVFWDENRCTVPIAQEQ